MKVYVALYVDYDVTIIVGVFQKREDAVRASEQYYYIKRGDRLSDIEEHELR